MPFDSSRQGADLMSQWLSDSQPQIVGTTMENLRDRFQQQIVAPGMKLYYPLLNSGESRNIRDFFGLWSAGEPPTDPPGGGTNPGDPGDSSSSGGSSSGSTSAGSGGSTSDSFGSTSISSGSTSASFGSTSITSAGSQSQASASPYSSSSSYGSAADCGEGPNGEPIGCEATFGTVWGYQRCASADSNPGDIDGGMVCLPEFNGATLCECWTNCDRCDEIVFGSDGDCCTTSTGCGINSPAVGEGSDSNVGQVICCYDNGTIQTWEYLGTCCACF